MANCTICGKWSGLRKLHEDCEQAEAAGKFSPRFKGVEDNKANEMRLGDQACRAAKAYETCATLLMVLITLGCAMLFGHFAPDGLTVLGFIVGSAVGVLACASQFNRARMLSFDVQRRQRYMARN